MRSKKTNKSTRKTAKADINAQKFCIVDIETYSDVDLLRCGTANYFDSPHAGLHCLCYKIDNQPTQRVWLGGNYDGLPDELRKFRGRFIAHNWFFEWYAAKTFFPKTPLADIRRWLCTAAMARRYHIAGSRAALDETARRCGAKALKLHEGKRLIAAYSVPNKTTGEFLPVPDVDKALWLEYCAHDVELTALVFARLWPEYKNDAFELKVFEADKIQQARGVPIDLAGAKLLVKAGEKLIADTTSRAEALAGRSDKGTLILTSNTEFLRLLKTRYKIEIPNAQAATLAELVHNNSHPELHEIIELRSTLMTRATDKADKLLSLTSVNGRYYSPSVYSAAHTGRWMSWGANFFNFYKYAAPADKWEQTLKTQLHTPTREGLASLQRGLIKAPPGKTLVITDWRGIENYLALYYAKDTAQLQAIERGESQYLLFGSKLYGRPITREDKREYNLAKIAVLSLGYGAGAAKFHGAAKAMGMELSLSNAEHIVKVWRASNPAITSAWRNVERAFRAVLHNPFGRTASAGNIKFYGRENVVRVELPNGYKLYYPNCAIDNTGELSWSADGVTREKLYGGKIWENIIQALSAQILRRALVLLEEAGIPVILHVHDEIIVECDVKNAKSVAKKIADVMTSAPEWAPGMKLAVEQKIEKRWGK